MVQQCEAVLYHAAKRCPLDARWWLIDLDGGYRPDWPDTPPPPPKRKAVCARHLGVARYNGYVFVQERIPREPSGDEPVPGVVVVA